MRGKVKWFSDSKGFGFMDGFANYGLLPDLLQDLKDLGMTEQAFTTLFSSAEDYIQTWEKAVALSGCASTNPNCQPVTKPPACGATSQSSSNGAHL